MKVFPTKLDRRTLAAFNREQATMRTLPPDLPILRPDAMEQLADGRHALRMELCAQSLTLLLSQVGTLLKLDFAVIIAEQGEPDRTLLAYRDHTMTVPVDPQHKSPRLICIQYEYRWARCRL